MNIHLVALYYEKWFRKESGRSINSIFEPIIEDLKQLEKGIVVEYINEEGKSEQLEIHGTLLNCIHDNLASHKQFGLSGGFNTMYPCALCFEDVESHQSLFKESTNLRKPDYYAPLGKLNYSSDLTASFGVRERTMFGDLNYYNIGEAMAFDPLHDLEEGLDKEVLHAMFGSLYKGENKKITKEEINARAQSFDYGGLDYQYVPHSFNLDKNGLGLSAIQLRNFLLRFIFIYGDLEDEINKAKFDVIRNLILIHKFAYSPLIYEHQANQMQTVIENFLHGAKTELDLRITVKLHNLTHYVPMLRRIGSMLLVNTAACESKHHFFNVVAYSISNMSQLLRNFALSYMEDFVDTWENAKDVSFVKNSLHQRLHDPESIGLQAEDEVYELKFHIDHFAYRPGFIVSKKNDENIQFFKIQKVLMIKDELYLHCSTLHTEYKEESVSFKILETLEDSILIAVKDLQYKVTHSTAFSRKDSQEYVLTKILL